MKKPDSGNVPSAVFSCFTVLQHDNILCPADGHGFCQDLRRIFICPVKLPHPAEVPGGEAGSVRISFSDIAGGSDSGAFLRPGADQLADFLVQLHLRLLSRHQNIQLRKHDAVVYRFSNVHGLLPSGTSAVFSLLPCNCIIPNYMDAVSFCAESSSGPIGVVLLSLSRFPRCIDGLP